MGAVRSACGIAAGAFATGGGKLRAGQPETEAAAQFLHGLVAPPGEDADLLRLGGFCWCMSGPNAAGASGAFARSRARRLREGEPVLVHANSYRGGFWTDITRTYCLGQPDELLLRVWDAVFAARAAALAAIRPGVRAAEVDSAAREVLRSRGFGDAFRHGTGHGVGFAAIDHNARPRLHPQSDDTLAVGMVFNVEPAVYLEGWGGVRHCDVVAVTAGGAEVLTPFQDRPELLTLPVS
jgi:Xaa-Pro aminopeptidase/Xaa-Pro dipeptidase